MPIDANKKVDEERIERIKSLEEMLFMTSHQVRRPIVNFLGLANQLADPTNSNDETVQIISYIKESVVSLDSYTKELASYICEVNKNTKGKQLIKKVF